MRRALGSLSAPLPLGSQRAELLHAMQKILLGDLVDHRIGGRIVAPENRMEDARRCWRRNRFRLVLGEVQCYVEFCPIRAGCTAGDDRQNST